MMTIITEISDFPGGVYTRKSHKIKRRNLKSGSDKILLVDYIRTRHLIESRSVIIQEFSTM